MNSTQPQDTVPLVPSRAEAIADFVNLKIEDIVQGCLYLKMPPGETEPTWVEIRNAILEQLFEIEFETGRLDLYAEQVQENCL